jgi:hypothetical protein
MLVKLGEDVQGTAEAVQLVEAIKEVIKSFEAVHGLQRLSSRQQSL